MNDRILNSRWALDCLVESCYVRLEDEVFGEDTDKERYIGYFLSISKQIKPVAEQIVSDHNSMLVIEADNQLKTFFANRFDNTKMEGLEVERNE